MTAPEYPDWIGELQDDPEYQAELATLRGERAPDPVVAALEAIASDPICVCQFNAAQGIPYRHVADCPVIIATNALPIARAQAALAAADLAVEMAQDEFDRTPLWFGASKPLNAAREARHEAFAAYRAALEAQE